MSARKFKCVIAFIMLAFFVAVTSGGCDSDDGDSVMDTLSSLVEKAKDKFATYGEKLTDKDYELLVKFNVYGDNDKDNSKTEAYDTASEDNSIKEPAKSSVTSLSGYVWKYATSYTNAANPEAVRGATVTLSPTVNGSPMETRTEDDGYYTFNLSNTQFSGNFASYYMEVNAANYNAFESYVEVEKGMQHEINVALVAESKASGELVARDAQNNNPISGVSVQVYNEWNVDTATATPILRGTTDSSGKYDYSNNNLEAGYYTVKMSKTGYIDTVFNITLNAYDANDANTRNVDNGYLSKEMDSNEFRVVLTWGIYPTDLDSHLYGRNSSGQQAHVYYASRNGSLSGETVFLDRDDVTSYGPETTTFKIDNSASYEYFIHWYSYPSGGYYDWSRTEVKVDLYRGDRHIGTYTAPPESTGRYPYWRVFKIDRGTIVPLNTYAGSLYNITSNY